MRSDIELFKEFDGSGYNNKAYNALSLVNNAINGGSIELLDIPRCRSICIDVMDYLALKQRFLFMKREVNDKLSFTDGKFKLYEHEFSTLDEVEKAIKNKAFL